MCLILFSYQQHPKYKLVLAANRDEFYARKTKSADYWNPEKHIIGGRDLEASGTWMGVTLNGRISMLTNYRDITQVKNDAPSRGLLVSDFLVHQPDPQPYFNEIEKKKKAYNGFNLVAGTSDELWYISNYSGKPEKLDKGIHGLSNALLNSSWPKVDKGKLKLKNLLDLNQFNENDLFDLLYDDLIAPDHSLPNTGVGLEKERVLSPMFIKSPGYGSRCSTVILIDRDNSVRFFEREYNPDTFEYRQKEFSFTIL